MYFYSVKIQAVTSKNREIQRSVIAMAASPWEAMKKVSDVSFLKRQLMESH